MITAPTARDARSSYDEIVREKADSLYDIEKDRSERLENTYRAYLDRLIDLQKWAKDNGLLDTNGRYPWGEGYQE